MGEDLPASQGPGIVYPVTTTDYDARFKGGVAGGMATYTAQVGEKRAALIQQLGGNVEVVAGVNVWDALRQRELSTTPPHEAQTILDFHMEYWANKVPGEGGDAVDEVFIAVASDMMDGTRTDVARPGPDDEYFTAGEELIELLRGDQLADPAVLTKATAAIHLLGQYGLYKMASKQRPGQMLQAAQLMEDFARVNPDFDPVQAGYIPLVSNVVLSRAILQVDEQSKPHLKEDPSSSVRPLLEATDQVLGHLARAHTYAALTSLPSQQQGTAQA